LARPRPVSLLVRQAAYDQACERAAEVMERWLDARVRGPVPVALEREAAVVEADVRRAAAKLAATRRRLGLE
jgi:hypothetical protein